MFCLRALFKDSGVIPNDGKTINHSSLFSRSFFYANVKTFYERLKVKTFGNKRGKKTIKKAIGLFSYEITFNRFLSHWF